MVGCVNERVQPGVFCISPLFIPSGTEPMIRRNITYKEKSLIIPLYKAIVRPHLEYCIQAWNPYLRKDVDMLEKIQRRATKLHPSMNFRLIGGKLCGESEAILLAKERIFDGWMSIVSALYIT